MAARGVFRSALLLPLSALLLATACAGEGGELPEVTGDFGSEPRVVFTGPLPAEPQYQTILPGKGLPAGKDALLVVRMAQYVWNGSQGVGEPVFSNFSDGADVLLTVDDLGAGELFDDAGPGWEQGSRTVLSLPEDPSAGQETAAATAYVIDVVDHYVAGETVPGEQEETTEPPLGIDVSNHRHPRVVSPTTPPPEQLEKITLIEGEGDPVQEGDRVVIQFAGVAWHSGEVFDSTWAWNGRPSAYTVGIGQLIPGLDEALPGTPTGSRILVVVPPQLAFGSRGNPEIGIPEEETVIYTIDILGRH
ncbi:FKBP-type peptidyl-prolyl cis-trans isomerase [Thermobifida fusca]|uniref:FKBP-type peptidyl-prolyl cis-trans isomerase n=1 Tax=Thermobifida fusca TaxID=2021 RepID=UPI001D0CBDA2|nr:FKBP-type peptidyl-prolyl cis-trans isomerase [Thermobifida fusca]